MNSYKLLPIVKIGAALKIFAFETGDIDQHVLGRRFAGERRKRHWPNLLTPPDKDLRSRSRPHMPMRRVDDHKIPEPRLAIESEAEQLILVFCSGKEGIGLNLDVCSPEKHPQLLCWMRKACVRKRVWIINKGNTIFGILIFDKPAGHIAYIVVAESFRGLKLIGPRLVRHAQLVMPSLYAEARNAHSQRLLVRCGFHLTDETSMSGHPILTWDRGTK
jgi:hypothetical protein